MERLILCDVNEALCKCWSELFSRGFKGHVHIVNSGFEQVLPLGSIDCIVSPGNSFGLMDGGIDQKIIEFFGPELQAKVQRAILGDYFGQQPVGTSLVVETGHSLCPYLAHTPTMRVPASIVGTDNIYNAMRAMLIAVSRVAAVKTVLCPGLGTLTGKVSPEEAARQMYVAYCNTSAVPSALTWEYALCIARPLEKEHQCA
jgi:O-acetyl-ADP-ribose deacetylase (regulator of RNase III)